MERIRITASEFWTKEVGTCAGSSSNICVKNGVHLSQYTGAIACINEGAGDWIPAINATSCSTVGGSWTDGNIQFSSAYNYLISKNTGTLKAGGTKVHVGLKISGGTASTVNLTNTGYTYPVSILSFQFST